MWIVPEGEIAGLMTPEAAFDAVEAVFAAMARGDASNFPVVREAIGHEDALYGFKGGFDGAGMTLGLKAGGIGRTTPSTASSTTSPRCSCSIPIPGVSRRRWGATC